MSQPMPSTMIGRRELSGTSPVSVTGVKIIGERKGEWGIVAGKVGYLPTRGYHAVIHFEDEVSNKRVIGDKIQVKAKGVGLKLVNYPGVRVMNSSPKLKISQPRPVFILV